MAFCNKGHHFDEGTHLQCPDCANAGASPGGGGGGAPMTIYEGDDGPMPAGGAPQFPPLRPMGAPVPPTVHQQGSGGWGSGGFAAVPAAAGQKTVYGEEDESIERLMGFLLVVQSREEDEFRYIRLRKGVNRIGRFGSRSEIELRDGEASTDHGLIICTNKATRMVDLDSSNGTTVNGEKTEIALLNDGDSVTVGRTRMLFVGFPYIAED